MSQKEEIKKDDSFVNPEDAEYEEYEESEAEDDETQLAWDDYSMGI